MSSFTPKVFALCVALTIGPPIGLVALHYNQWLAPQPIDPRFAQGELLFFEGNYCGACQRMKPVVARLREEGFIIRTMEVEGCRQQAIDYGIHAVPTFVLVRDGHEVRRAVGVMSPESLQQLWR